LNESQKLDIADESFVNEHFDVKDLEIMEEGWKKEFLRFLTKPEETFVKIKFAITSACSEIWNFFSGWFGGIDWDQAKQSGVNSAAATFGAFLAKFFTTKFF